MSDEESSPADYGGYEDTSNYTEPETTSYSYTATAPSADNWTEQHEVTTLSFSDEPREERFENSVPTEDASPDFAKSNDGTFDEYRADDVAVPIGYTPTNGEYVTNNHITTNHYHPDNYHHRDYSHPRYYSQTNREYADWEIDWALKILQVLIGVVCIFVPVALIYKYNKEHNG